MGANSHGWIKTLRHGSRPPIGQALNYLLMIIGLFANSLLIVC